MNFTRRAALAAGIAALTAGCSTGMPPPRLPGTCRTPDALEDFSSLAGAPLGYEVGRTTTTFRADPRFVELLEAWAKDWALWSGFGAITTVWSYGAYVDKCDSFHGAGRAFDIAEVVHEGGSVSCRWDTWRPGTARQLRDYWRLAASFHLHFAYTLTHLYDAAHHNHIHVDNAVSGWEQSSFRPGSQVQVHMVQSACRHVFGTEVEVTGAYDEQTRDALRSVQASLGITRSLSDVEGWREFLRATASA